MSKFTPPPVAEYMWTCCNAANRAVLRSGKREFTVMRVSKIGVPQIIHFNGVFHYKPSILGYPYFRKHPYGVGYHPKSNSPVSSCPGVGASLPSLPPQKKTRPTNIFFSAGTVTKNRPFLQGKWHQRDDPRARDETIGEIFGCTFTSSKCPRSYEDDFAAWSSVLFKRG